MTINDLKIKPDDLDKIKKAAEEIEELSNKQDLIYKKLADELKLSKSGDDLVFDYVFNWFNPKGSHIKEISFVEYLNIYKLFKEPFYK